jgi:D-sedoheptulose 7-phosphate isomerase
MASDARKLTPWIAHMLRDGARLRARMASEALAIAHAAAVVVDSLRDGGKVLLFGNGGSAADAQHIAAELVGRFAIDRRPLPALALTVDTSALTAIANDYGYDHVFERQVRALGRAGDCAIAITTSGRSPNVLRGARAAKELGMKVVGLTGSAAGDLAAMCDAAVAVPTRETSRIQELHIAVGHAICAIVEAELCGTGLPPCAADKLVSLDELSSLREWYRAQGRAVVWAEVDFESLDAEHVSTLQAARKLGDVLVVGLGEDSQVTHRVALLSALEMVDHVLPFGHPTRADVLRKLEPDAVAPAAPRKRE